MILKIAKLIVFQSTLNVWIITKHSYHLLLIILLIFSMVFTEQQEIIY